MGTVTGALVNELHGGPGWWIAAAAATALCAGLAMWIAGQSDPAPDGPGHEGGQTLTQSTVGRDVLQIQHVGNLHVHPGSTSHPREEGVASAEPPSPSPGEPATAEAALGPAVTDTWRAPTDWPFAGVLLRLGENTLDHPSYSGRSAADAAPPSIRLGTVLACDRLPADALSTSDVRAFFLRFLDQPAMADLLADLTHVPEHAAWRSWSGNGRNSLCAVLARADLDNQAPPVAWARLNMPMPDSINLHDPRCAEFVLVLEPRTADGARAAALALAAWPERMTRMLTLPGLLADFLTDSLHLTTHAQPPAQAGIWLTTPSTLSALVDHTGYSALPGSRASSRFTGVCLADPAGEPAESTAASLVRQLCDHALCLNDYESIFEAQGAPPAAQPSDA